MRLGLSLSGGGARGISHIGILKAFEEAGISISMVTGTSAGAVVGAFHCHGYSPDEILEIIKSVRLFRYVRPAMSRMGLLKMESTEAMYKRFFPENDFAALKTPLVISTTNLRYGKTCYFSRGPLIPAIMASTAVPVVFNPVKIEGEYYVDGGILNNLPVEPLIGYVDKIVGINCNPLSENFEVGNMRSMLERSLLMAINVNSYSKKSVCDLFLEPPGLKNFRAVDISRAAQLFEIGYEYGKTVTHQVKALLTP